MNVLKRCNLVPPSSPAANSHNPLRLDFLDCLRGIAAMSVVVAHAGVALSPDFRKFAFSWFDLGNFGVMLFFLCSGFIIPRSLTLHPSLAYFWIRRICRLYPLYWFTIIVTLVASYQFHYDLLPDGFFDHPLGVTLANFTMLQVLFGYPSMSGLFWTLFWEMIFYFLVSVLYLTQQQNRLVPITVGLITTAVLVEAVLPLVGASRYPIGAVSYIATMFCGSVLYKMFSGDVSRRTGYMIAALGLAMVTITALGDPDGSAGIWRFRYLLTARMAAFIVFGVVLAWHSLKLPNVSLYIGRISYSLYLMHPFVIWFVPHAFHPVLTSLIWLMALLLLASFTYRWIEQPWISIGRRLTQPPTRHMWQQIFGR